MTPAEARALYWEARRKRPNLVFSKVPTMAELPKPKTPPSKHNRSEQARLKMSLAERAEHGLRMVPDKARHGQLVSEGMRRAKERRAAQEAAQPLQPRPAEG